MKRLTLSLSLMILLGITSLMIHADERNKRDIERQKSDEKTQMMTASTQRSPMEIFYY